jgi:hypothetical protein
MSEPKVISIKRNLAAGTAVVLLLLVALGGYYVYFNLGLPSPEDAVSVLQEKIDLPVEIQKTLTDLDVKGLILVSRGRKADGPTITLRVITPNGATIPLCGSRSETDKSLRPSCKLATTAKLVTYISEVKSPNTPIPLALSVTDSMGYCSDFTGTQQECHKKNRKYPYHKVGGHHYCSGPCQ